MDNYALVERLGQGSFAVVWKARRKTDGRMVAVKQLRQAPATWEECKRLPEIRAGAAARSQNIVALLEAVRHGNEFFLVFEYADSDLYRCMNPGKRFEETQVRWAMRQLLSGLAAVHQAGLVHCDVKPENLLLVRGPILKLCDLGQACPAGEVQTYVGTRWYRAPEMLLGLRGLGVEVDLWAAGCAMAELFLLRPAFPGSDARDMLFRICSDLGAPEEGWAFSEQLTQAAGLRFAPCAAEGPLWRELSDVGASAAAVKLAQGLLKYDQGKRVPATRALAAPFFAESCLEAPILPPDEHRRGDRSAEEFQRSRDEAKAVQKRLQAASATRDSERQSSDADIGFSDIAVSRSRNHASRGHVVAGPSMAAKPHSTDISAPRCRSDGVAAAAPARRSDREAGAPWSPGSSPKSADDDEELAALFWTQVENSRGAAAPARASQDAQVERRRRRPDCVAAEPSEAASASAQHEAFDPTDLLAHITSSDQAS